MEVFEAAPFPDEGLIDQKLYIGCVGLPQKHLGQMQNCGGSSEKGEVNGLEDSVRSWKWESE